MDLMEDDWEDVGDCVTYSAKIDTAYLVNKAAAGPVKDAVWSSVDYRIADSVRCAAWEPVEDIILCKLRTKQTYIDELRLWI